jgi:hypothetical protein
VSFNTHAKTPGFVARMAKMFGCGGLLTHPPLNPQVKEFAKTHPDTIVVTEDKEEPGTYHVRSRIYRLKDFPDRKNVAIDATDELNFVVDDSEVHVPMMEAKITNRGYHIVLHLPEHFPYAKLAHSEAEFGIQFFPKFISEIQSLGFDFY